MIVKGRICAFILPIVIASIANFHSPLLAFQVIDLPLDSLESAEVISPDTLQSDFSIELDEFLTFQDHDLSTWIQQFPHVWISRSSQVGHPHQVQILGRPVWMSEIRWLGMSMNDPVYGLLDLNFLPLITMTKLELRNSSINILPLEVLSTEPFSQVYYRQGKNNESEVDVLFQRGIGKHGSFHVGGTFFGFDGRLANSAVDNEKFRAQLHFQLWKKYKLTYRILTNRYKANYPGNIYENSVIQFSSLRRKVRRTDHFLKIDFPDSGKWVKSVTTEYHSDRRNYTGSSIGINTEDITRWGKVTGLFSHQSEKSISKISFNFMGTGASSLGFDSFHEFPVGISISSYRKIRKDIFALVDFDYTYHDKSWQSRKFNLAFEKEFSAFTSAKLVVFDNSTVPPLGWRNGKLLPFENQPWPLLFSTIDKAFTVQVKPNESVGNRGVRLQFSWNYKKRTQIFADLYYQHTRNLVFPAIADSTTKMMISPNFNSLGLFIKAQTSLGKAMKFSGRYQFSHYSNLTSPELNEIPNHQFWLQFHMNKILFNGNLDAHLFLTGEFLGSRYSYGYPQDLGLMKFLIDNVLLIHAKFMFHIGDARIFFQWQNLSDQIYTYRILQDQPGRNFQYGVIWTFWN